MKKYDFILFEHSAAINHFKDLEEIAKLLLRQRKKVAIADIRYEKEYCKNATIEHYALKKSFNAKLLSEKECRLSFFRDVYNKFVGIRYRFYLKYAVNELSKETSNIYVGSFFNFYTYFWLKNVSPDVNVYLWGLRSYWFRNAGRSYLSISKISSFFNIKMLVEKPNIKLFVSNENIKNEFVEMGVSPNKLIVRPERTTLRLSVFDDESTSGKLRLLTIGSLRRDKRVELTLRALHKLRNSDIEFVVAGSSFMIPDYEKDIENRMNDLENVTRVNKRLEEAEYLRFIEECDFLVLCDKQQPSCFTNGTMDEALIHGKPIIAPNYDPYKNVVEKYGVGILFDPASIDSLCAAILTAKQRGRIAYKANILDYQKTLLVDRVSREFVKQLGLDN